VQTRALSNPGIAAMLQADREDNLDEDCDRLLFGLPVLSEEEITAASPCEMRAHPLRRLIAPGTHLRRRQGKAKQRKSRGRLGLERV
jgi:hypothetical protein